MRLLTDKSLSKGGSSFLCGAIAALTMVAAAPSSASAATLFLERIMTGADVARPIHAAAPPGDDERLFVLDRDSGAIKIYDRASESVLSTPFLSNVAGLGFTHPEEGAQSIAFAPDYATSGLFYVSFVNTEGDHQVVEYSVSASDPNVANASSARSIITVDHPDDGGNGHFAGWIGFDQTGALFVSTGDSNSDPINDVSQEIENQLGSILRIDPRADAFPGDAANNYAPAAGNPFISQPGDDAVWAFGLRNPFRPSIDPLTGTLFIADVGEDMREEINIGAAGANYGWPGYEGSAEFDLSLLTGATTDLTFPIYEYDHGTGAFEGFSVTGGGVYRGPLAEINGLYFFGDFATGAVWSFRYDDIAGTVSDLMSWTLSLDAGALNNLTSFAFDSDGNMYLMDIVTGDVFAVAGAVAEIPIPAAFFLMSAGLAGLFGAARRQPR